MVKKNSRKKLGDYEKNNNNSFWLTSHPPHSKEGNEPAFPEKKKIAASKKQKPFIAFGGAKSTKPKFWKKGSRGREGIEGPSWKRGFAKKAFHRIKESKTGEKKSTRIFKGEGQPTHPDEGLPKGGTGPKGGKGLWKNKKKRGQAPSSKWGGKKKKP